MDHSSISTIYAAMYTNRSMRFHWRQVFSKLFENGAVRGKHCKEFYTTNAACRAQYCINPATEQQNCGGRGGDIFGVRDAFQVPPEKGFNPLKNHPKRPSKEV